MAFWIENYTACLIISVLLAGLIIPKIMLIAFRKKLFDEIDERKVHHGVVPRLGGIAFLPSMIFSFCMVIGYNIRMGHPQMLLFTGESLVPVFFIMCALMLMYLCGMADDLIGVRYRAKFIFQIVAAILIVTSGMWLRNFDGFLGIGSLNYWIGWILSVVVIVYIINAVNLIDGIDGLASGLSGMALIFYSYVFFESGQMVYFLLCGATLGTLLPFFYFNVFGRAEKHKKIFMGDTGALTIGTILAFCTMAVTNIPLDDLPANDNRLVLAVAPILVPCFDVLRVFWHRLRQGRNPFMPDKCHIHHKLLALGCKQWQALILILLLDCIFIIFNMIFSSEVSSTWLIIIDIVIWTLFNIVLTSLIRSREKRIGQQLYE